MTGIESATVDAPPEPDRLGFVRAASTSGFHKIAYADWGPPDSESVVVCVHGLTRQGRDFDFLARHLADAGHRVVCPDLVGRGRSEWLPNSIEYVFPQYCADMSTVLAAIGADKVSWVGSSLGGLIGIVLAGLARSPISRLIVNDIGPQVPYLAGMRVASLLNTLRPEFRTMEEAEHSFRTAFATYGDLADEHWRHITRHSVSWDEHRERFVLRFDPKIVPSFQMFLYYQMTLWGYWEKIEGPIMCIRGCESDFLPPFLFHDMQRRTRDLQVLEVEGVGHMPMLMSAAEIDAIGSFLGR